MFLTAAVLIALSVSAYALSPEEAAAMDLTSPSGLTAEELAPALGELAPYAADFIMAERETGVKAVFLAALAAFESGWGRYCQAENNIFGWSGPSFATKGECIAEVSRRIAKNYLTEGGRYYRGSSLAGVNTCYNGSGCWLSGMCAMMAQIGTNSGCAAPEEEPFFGELPYEGEPETPKRLCGEFVKVAAL